MVLGVDGGGRVWGTEDLDVGWRSGGEFQAQ